jgi:eukaryotic-like serine/threonine-protein kinase
MTSTTTGLPDRYRPLDRVGSDEPTPTGVIQCWRAKDRVLNRDVAIRVHTPAGPAAHAWIARALTAGGLANPALAMVYDASEGSVAAAGDAAPGSAAYVVNEWIDGETLAERLSRGPLAERETRTVLRRLADGVAEAHRVGLAVGGLTPENVVLRPNGLVGLRAVPAASGTTDGDVAALGELLEVCLTGLDESAPRSLSGPPDLVALVHRARSTEPGQALASVAAMAALLAQAPRTGPSARTQPHGEDGARRRRARDRRPAATARPAEAPAPVRLDPNTLPPVPPVRPITDAPGPVPSAALGGDTVAAPGPPPAAVPAEERWRAADYTDDYADDPLPAMTRADGDEDGYEDAAERHRLVVVGLPLLALAVVIALAWWIGSSVLSVAGSVDDTQGSTPSASASGGGQPADEEPAPAGAPATVSGATVFDPGGDGAPENDDDVPLTYDDDPSTSWSTLQYRGSPAFGNLKEGVGIVYDLGESQALAGIVLETPTPGATVEVRTADRAGQELGDYDVAASGTLEDTTDLAFDAPVTARYVLVWITGLVDGPDGFSAGLAEVTVQSAG